VVHLIAAGHSAGHSVGHPSSDLVLEAQARVRVQLALRPKPPTTQE
jgi:hypothetical protein